MPRSRRTRAKLVRKLNADYRRRSRGYEKKLSPLFKAFGKAAEAAARQVGVPAAEKADGLDDDWRAAAKKIEKKLAKRAAALGDALGDVGAAQVALIADSTTKVMIAEGALDVGFNLPDKRVRQLMQRGGTRLLGIDVQGQTRTAVFRTLAESRAQGHGVDKMARLIRDQVGGGPWRSSATRARVIARTETHWAQNQSTIEATQASGVEYVQAVDDQIGHGDEDCAARNGQVYAIADAAGIEDHPNGTLMWVPWEGPKP